MKEVFWNIEEEKILDNYLTFPSECWCNGLLKYASFTSHIKTYFWVYRYTLSCRRET